jgi:hypothetical protein
MVEQDCRGNGIVTAVFYDDVAIVGDTEGKWHGETRHGR